MSSTWAVTNSAWELAVHFDVLDDIEK